MTRFVSQVLFFKRLFIYVLNIRLLVHFLQDDSPTKFGFLPCRVYLFSLFFSKDIVSVALYSLSTIHICLGLRLVVSSRYHDLLIRHVQTLQTSQFVEAWTFLYFRSNRFLRVIYILHTFF